MSTSPNLSLPFQILYMNLLSKAFISACLGACFWILHQQNPTKAKQNMVRILAEDDCPVLSTILLLLLFNLPSKHLLPKGYSLLPFIRVTARLWEECGVVEGGQGIHQGTFSCFPWSGPNYDFFSLSFRSPWAMQNAIGFLNNSGQCCE